ncbi:hypothetical protein RF11_04188 [Thelohanellus kitauei]|uniref:Uncharacterized protein n=1 Tax=Thelohanellus kitauei TaxID=669202 RepID=A0A0C2IHM0_THEKT|nr:hypothetical protein RF11_04188 [Thelohanellus kitauei]
MPLTEAVSLLDPVVGENYSLPLRKPCSNFQNELISAIDQLISSLDSSLGYPDFICAAHKIFLASTILLKHGLSKPPSRKFLLNFGRCQTTPDPRPKPASPSEAEIRNTRRVVAAIDRWLNDRANLIPKKDDRATRVIR